MRPTRSQVAVQSRTNVLSSRAPEAEKVLEIEPTSHRELRRLLRGRVDVSGDVEVAVDALVIDSDGHWLLHRRGPGCRDEVGLLEGLGGAVDPDELFRAALAREIHEEAGDQVDVEIGYFLGGRLINTPDHEPPACSWLVMSYLCQLRNGEPQITEPAKNAGFVRVRPGDVDPRHLSTSARAAWRWLRAHPDRISGSCQWTP